MTLSTIVWPLLLERLNEFDAEDVCETRELDAGQIEADRILEK